MRIGQGPRRAHAQGSELAGRHREHRGKDRRAHRQHRAHRIAPSGQGSSKFGPEPLEPDEYVKAVAQLATGKFLGTLLSFELSSGRVIVVKGFAKNSAWWGKQIRFEAKSGMQITNLKFSGSALKDICLHEAPHQRKCNPSNLSKALQLTHEAVSAMCTEQTGSGGC